MSKHKRKLYYCSHSKSCTYTGNCPHKGFHFETKNNNCHIGARCGSSDDFTICINVLDPDSNILRHKEFIDENGYSLLKEDVIT